MKQTLLLLAIAAIIAPLAGCEKTSCYECLLSSTTTVNGADPQTTTASSTTCDITEAEARQLEQENTRYDSSSSGGHTVVVRQTTVCQ